MKRLLPVLMGFALLLLSSTEGWGLPPCPEDQTQGYHNCFGTFTSDDGNKYVGEWKDDKYHGQGTYTYANGNKYVGEFKNDKYHGQGTYTYANGNKYVGEWKDDKRNGHATFTFANGNKYVGEFKDDKINGQGTYYYLADDVFKGDKYVGEWKDNNKYGQGTYTFAKSGNKYVGEHRDGKLHGQGTLTFANGDKYVGEWKRGSWQGHGTHTFADGTKYVGEYKDGKIHGQGTYTFADGQKYVGEFKDGESHGHGTHTFADGTKYVGEWKDDNYHGQGILYHADGTVDQEGIWENDEFKYARKLSPSVTAEKQERLKLEIELEKLKKREPSSDLTQVHSSRDSTALEERIKKLEELIGKLSPQNPTPPPKSIIDFSNKRIALVVGNSKYKVRPLDNPVRDVHLIKTTLEEKGFTVIIAEDVDHREFRKALAEFKNALKDAGPETTAFFYYSGHGLQYQGNNYLIPIGSKFESEIELDLDTIRAERVQAAMASITGVKIMLLDACRDSPFKSFVRSKGLGLAQMDAPKGTIIGYSTSPGKVAIDGTGENSPYALGLVKAIRMPGLKIEEVLKQTLNWVDDMTNGKQVPWYSSSLRGDFYFSKK